MRGGLVCCWCVGSAHRTFCVLELLQLIPVARVQVGLHALTLGVHRDAGLAFGHDQLSPLLEQLQRGTPVAWRGRGRSRRPWRQSCRHA